VTRGSIKSERQAREAQGRAAEKFASIMLRLKCYRILARRYKCPAGEIDLIVKRGKAIAFVEVKARKEIGQALDSITPRQKQRIARAAQSFLQLYPEYLNCELRFDVILIVPNKWPHHIMDAWRDS
tara:strand:- start:5652 stop:6029 length:378 start_codon:yes stop_codon:yes gene_type:complete